MPGALSTALSRDSQGAEAALQVRRHIRRSEVFSSLLLKIAIPNTRITFSIKKWMKAKAVSLKSFSPVPTDSLVYRRDLPQACVSGGGPVARALFSF